MLLTKMCLKVDEWRDYIASVWEENSKKYHKEWNAAKFKTRTTTKKDPTGNMIFKERIKHERSFSFSLLTEAWQHIQR